MLNSSARSNHFIYGSLVRRILLIGILLILIPLLIHAAIVWDRDWQTRLDSVLNELELMGKADKKIYEDWVELSSVDPKIPLSLKENALVFHQKEGGETSIPLQKWISFFVGSVTLVEKGPSNANENLVVFTPQTLSEWEDNAGYLESHRLKKKNIALQIPLENATFDLQVMMTSPEIEKVEGVNIHSGILTLLICLIILGGIISYWLIRRMARPFNYLYEVIEAVGEKKYDRRYRIDSWGFEINELGKNFNRMLERLLRHMEEVKNERFAKEILLKELAIGHEIQKELLPKEIPQFPSLEMGSGFLSAKEVAGDFYDLYVKDKGHLLLTIADGSDKGVSACLYSLMVRSMLRSNAAATELVDEIVGLTNSTFYKDASASGNFVTAWVGFYNSITHELTYTNAGHLPGILIDKEGHIEELTTKGIALGVSEIVSIEVKTRVLSPGSFLFLYTDGVTEAQNKKGELFGKSRLLEFLRTSHRLPPQKLINELISSIITYSEDTSLHDDLTILCVKRLNN